MSETRALVADVMSTVLNQPVTDDIQRANLPAWDSLKHVELLFALEDACEVSFDQAELSTLDSLDAIVTSVERHRGN